MKLLTAVVAICLGLLTMPAFAAYEARLIGVEAKLNLPVILIRHVDGPKIVPTDTEQEWILTYRILNIYDHPMADLKLQDKFGTHLEVKPISMSGGDYRQSSNKNGSKQRFYWSLESLERRDQETLQISVSTGLKDGKQMFIDPGKYVLANRAKLKWIDNDGARQETDTDVLTVIAE